MLLCCFVYLSAVAQPYRVIPVRGLSQNTVYGITQDAAGFLWIATANGLNRFDGTNVEQFTDLDENGRPSVIRSRLVWDENHRLWFNNGHHLMRLNSRTGALRRWTNESADSLLLMAEPLLFQNGYVWLCNRKKQLLRYSTQDSSVTVYPVPTQLNPAKTSFSSGSIWFLTGDSLASFSVKTFEYEAFPLPGKIQILDATDSLLFLTGSKELFIHSVNNPLKTLRRIALPVAPTALLVKRSGELVAGTADGRVFSIGMDMQLRFEGKISQPDGPLFPVLSLFEDRFGAVWTGSDVDGLNKLVSTQGLLQTLATSADSKPFTYALLRMHTDTLLLGTYQQGLLEVHLPSGKAQRKMLPVCSGDRVDPVNVYLLKRDEQNNLWVGADNGNLFVRRPESACFQRADFLLPPSFAPSSLRFFSLQEQEGRMVFGTSAGIFIGGQEQGKWRFNHEKRPFAGHVHAIWLHNDEKRLFAGFEGNFWEIDLSSEVNPDYALLNIGVHAINPASDGIHLWLATDVGPVLFHPDERRFRFVDISGQLKNPKTYAVLEASGALWASTDDGLWRIDQPLSEKPRALRLEAGEGAANEFVTGAFAADAGGNLYFGTTAGPVWVNPSMTQTNPILPVPVLKRILVNEKPWKTPLETPFLSGIVLHYDENQLSFDVSAFHPDVWKGLKFRVRLSGWDRVPFQRTSGSDIRYSNLSPGTYTLLVSASANNGIWSDEKTVLKITIVPPFWKQSWFIVLSALLITGAASGLTFLIARIRNQRKIIELERRLALDEERLRISREMHDDLGAGLTRISLLSEQARVQPGSTGESLHRIASSSRELIQSLQEIIWTMKPDNARLPAFLNYFREQVGRQTELLPMQTMVDVPEEAGEIDVSPDVQRNLLLIAREAVHNAVKYSGASKLEVFLRRIDRELHLKITDNGVGFDVEKVRKGNGLMNMSARAKALNGRLDIQSSPEKGTVIFVRMPLAPL
jgi:signal transduction histidine kinase/ligand-binding sensor domain-containing protein